jgi:hypothetical protein
VSPPLELSATSSKWLNPLSSLVLLQDANLTVIVLIYFVSHIIPNGLLQSNKYLFIGPFCHGVEPYKFCFPLPEDEGSVAQIAM